MFRKILYITSTMNYTILLRYLVTLARNAPGHVRRVTAALRSVLPPKVRLEIAKSHGPNIDLKIAGHRIGARWVGSGLIGATRSVLEASARPPDVVVARQMSPGARELLSG